MVSMLTAKSVAEICAKLNEKIGFSGFHFSFYSLILTKPSTRTTEFAIWATKVARYRRSAYFEVENLSRVPYLGHCIKT